MSRKIDVLEAKSKISKRNSGEGPLYPQKIFLAMLLTDVNHALIKTLQGRKGAKRGRFNVILWRSRLVSPQLTQVCDSLDS